MINLVQLSLRLLAAARHYCHDCHEIKVPAHLHIHFDSLTAVAGKIRANSCADIATSSVQLGRLPPAATACL
jgi:hypothetical protein